MVRASNLRTTKVKPGLVFTPADYQPEVCKFIWSVSCPLNATAFPSSERQLIISVLHVRQAEEYGGLP